MPRRKPDSNQLGMFADSDARPASTSRESKSASAPPQRRAGKGGKKARGKRADKEARTPKQELPELRQYTTKNGRRYELRRVS